MQFFYQFPFTKEKRALFVLIFGCLFGLIAGLSQPTSQVAVEQGQVLAGIVQYPLNNPFFIYQSKTWTFLAQFSAIGLRLGVSEIVLSLFFSGLAGVLSFSGFALWVFALSDDVLFALLAPPLFIKIFNTFVWGFGYPITVLGTEHTYGVIGMAFIFFVCGLFAVGFRKWAWLLVGLSPAIHPSLGFWFNITMWISLLSDFKNLRLSLPESIKFSLLGYALSTTSLVVQLSNYQIPTLNETTAHKYLQAYLTNWDNHRMPIDFWGIDISMIGIGMFVSIIWLLFKKGVLPHNGSFILRIYVATVTIGGMVIVILYAPFPFQIPDALWIIMPTRFLNFAFISYLPLVLGLLWQYRSQTNIGIITTIVVVCLSVTIFSYSSSLWYLLFFQMIIVGVILLVITRNEKNFVENLFVFLLVFVALTHFLRSSAASNSVINISSRTQAAIVSLIITSVLFAAPKVYDIVFKKATFLLAVNEALKSKQLFQQNMYPTQIISYSTLTLIFIWTMPLIGFFHTQKSFVDNFYSSSLRAMTTQSHGQIIIGPGCSTMIQFITRRPVLNYMPINMLPYAIEGAPSMEKILHDIYDMDFFSPPAPIEHIQSVWEKRSALDWFTLGSQYNASEVLAPSSWLIQLTHIGNDSTCKLYRVLISRDNNFSNFLQLTSS